MLNVKNMLEHRINSTMVKHLGKDNNILHSRNNGLHRRQHYIAQKQNCIEDNNILHRRRQLWTTQKKTTADYSEASNIFHRRQQQITQETTKDCIEINTLHKRKKIAQRRQQAAQKTTHCT